jgi:ThiF family
VKNTCRIRVARHEFDRLFTHLFPGDHDEHGAVLLAGTALVNNQLVLYTREVHPAQEGADYVEGTYGYRALSPKFIHRLITRARDQRLAYLAVHNHGTDTNVGFSSIDMDSHERGYPALLQIAKGMPVGALVAGRRSLQADIWLPGGNRLQLDEAVLVGQTISRLTPAPKLSAAQTSDNYDRQVRMFGKAGQELLARSRVGIVGLGGIGSLVAEYLARLGVGEFCLVDNDRVETTNLSRIVGATTLDAREGTLKVLVTERVIRQANDGAVIQAVAEDVAKQSTAQELRACDFLFIAADSMRARLVCNAVVHQYLIPAVQLGSKIQADESGALLEVFSVNRPLRPGQGCLWCNQLIDPSVLATEAKTDEERKAQAYGVEEPNPSVISLNAVAAAHAVNDFLLDYLNLRPERPHLFYEQFHMLQGKQRLVEPRKDIDCSECSATSLRYARGDSVGLPCYEDTVV